jgi:hypothetical protein
MSEEIMEQIIILDRMVYDNYEFCLTVRNQINTNMGYDGVTANHDNPREINNPEHIDYGKWFIMLPEGDEEHHALWMTGVHEKSEEHPEGYELKEYDPNWFLPIEI